MDYINDDVELTKDKGELTLELLMPYDTEEEYMDRTSPTMSRSHSDSSALVYTINIPQVQGRSPVDSLEMFQWGY